MTEQKIKMVQSPFPKAIYSPCRETGLNKGFLSLILSSALKSTPFSKLECPQGDMTQHYLLNLPLLDLYCLSHYIFDTFFRLFSSGLLAVHVHFLCS